MVHGKKCSLGRITALLQKAGTPCIAWSDMGLGEGLDAESTGHFLIWAGIRLRLQEPVIILENVLNFPRWLLIEVLPMYFMDFVTLTPAMLGWPISRERQYCVNLGLSLVH